AAGRNLVALRFTKPRFRACAPLSRGDRRVHVRASRLAGAMVRKNEGPKLSFDVARIEETCASGTFDGGVHRTNHSPCFVRWRGSLNERLRLLRSMEASSKERLRLLHSM